MSYLLDKKLKRDKIFKYAIILLLLLVVIYFRSPIGNGLSSLSHSIFRPVIMFGNSVGQSFAGVFSGFYSKNSLISLNEQLKLKLEEKEAEMSNYNSIADENLELKEILRRKTPKMNFILAAVLSKPNKSPYDTIIIDVGSKDSISPGDRVFAYGNVPIGRVTETYSYSSKVILFSSPGEKSEVIISGRDIFLEIIGRGGGNFEMILPRDFTLEKGNEVVFPGLTSQTIATVETIISDPRDAFQKALLISPVNIQELKFVQVEK